jgi:renalase
MNNTTVIIGAGISGLLLARELTGAGARVVVLEKSRGLGGRMATKRVGDAVFDQGAQYFTARDPAFVACVDDWRGRGWIKTGTMGEHRRWVGSPSMTAVPKGLAEGLEILREHKVTAARHHECGCWELDIEDGGIIRAERLLFTCPVPQALGVLSAGECALPPEINASLQALTYHPCLALLVVLDGPSALPAEGLVLTEGPVRWLADNVKKGVVQSARAAVTIHASAAFSETNYGRPEAEIVSMLLSAVQERLGGGVVSTALHRWKFSEPKTTHAERSVWLADIGLGFAGDAFGGPKVEGAALSGLALAARVRADLRLPSE